MSMSLPITVKNSVFKIDCMVSGMFFNLFNGLAFSRNLTLG